MDPLTVSVIIPTYNRAALVGRAIRSALAQCQAGDEVIVIDDGSTDDTPAVVDRFGDAVRYVQQRNAGAGAARNHGVRLARNPVVAFLDSDDEWMPGKLQLQRALLAVRPEVLFCFSNFAITTPQHREHRNYLARWLRLPRHWREAIGPSQKYSQIAAIPQGHRDFDVYIGNLYAAQIVDNYVLTSSLAVRREAAGTSLLFAEDLPTYEDWYCFGRLARHGLGAYLDCETAWQHGHSEGRLTDADSLTCAVTRNTLVERIWSQDQEFVATHAAWYQRALELNRLSQARALMRCGRAREARQLLRQIAVVPYIYRWLAWLPGPLVKCLVLLHDCLPLLA